MLVQEPNFAVVSKGCDPLITKRYTRNLVIRVSRWMLHCIYLRYIWVRGLACWLKKIYIFAILSSTSSKTLKLVQFLLNKNWALKGRENVMQIYRNQSFESIRPSLILRDWALLDSWKLYIFWELPVNTNCIYGYSWL